jgi:hypothetical protein
VHKNRVEPLAPGELRNAGIKPTGKVGP